VHRERLGELEGGLEIGLVVMEDPAQDVLWLGCRPIGETAQGVDEGPAPDIGMDAEGRQGPQPFRYGFFDKPQSGEELLLGRVFGREVREMPLDDVGESLGAVLGEPRQERPHG
jgi:hypothetical protein